MARKYYSRRRIIVRPKVKWSPHMETISETLDIDASAAFAYYPHVVCANATDSHLPSVPVVQVTRINFQGHVGVNTPSAEWYLYFIYVPEGVDSSLGSWAAWQAYINSHPEYIMARTIASSDFVTNGNTTTTLKLSTSMKRNLNSGDQVVALFVWNVLYTGSSALHLPIQGQLSYYTKVN